METIDIAIGSTTAEVKKLFSYSKANALAKLKLTDLVSHSLNQTLQRDGFWGAWTDAYQVDGNRNGPYRVKITSPTHDVSPYGELLPQYLTAGRIALEIYEKKKVHGTNFHFLLPFGLALANIQSVQLYHFPPTETFSYLDYLYSPTNRRWECLLAQNGFDGQN